MTVPPQSPPPLPPPQRTAQCSSLVVMYQACDGACHPPIVRICCIVTQNNCTISLLLQDCTIATIAGNERVLSFTTEYSHCVVPRWTFHCVCLSHTHSNGFGPYFWRLNIRLSCWKINCDKFCTSILCDVFVLYYYYLTAFNNLELYSNCSSLLLTIAKEESQVSISLKLS
jgi:hypothetical protein